MWIRKRLTAIAFVLFVGSGCTSSLVGAWSPMSDTVQEGEFSSVQFRNDGSFSAVSMRAGEESLMSGKYDFDGFTLTLKPPGKATKGYKATYFMNGTLSLKGDGVDQTLKKK